MRTRRSPRNQDRLYKAIGHELAQTAHVVAVTRTARRYPICPAIHIRRDGQSSAAAWCCKPCAAKAELRQSLKRRT